MTTNNFSKEADDDQVRPEGAERLKKRQQTSNGTWKEQETKVPEKMRDKTRRTGGRSSHPQDNTRQYKTIQEKSIIGGLTRDFAWEIESKKRESWVFFSFQRKGFTRKLFIPTKTSTPLLYSLFSIIVSDYSCLTCILAFSGMDSRM